MPGFKLKEDLPQSVQNRIDFIQAKVAALRTTEEQAFLDALNDYLYNEVILRDSIRNSSYPEGRIVWAAGLHLPEGDTGFKKGAMFIIKNGSGMVS